MKPQPPRGATFLMERVGQCDPSLMGDLAEEFAVRGSRGWYWREALAATANSVLHQVRDHPLLLLRAIAAYLVIFGIVTSFTALVVRHAPVLLQIVSISSYLRAPVLEIVSLVAILPICSLAAWAVSRFHPSVRVPATFVIILWWFVGDAELRRLLGNIGDLRFLPYLLAHVAELMEFVFGMLIGGLMLPMRETRVAEGDS